MEKNYADQSETEIDLADLCAYFLQKWKGILLCGILFMLLVGGFKAVKSFHTMQDQTAVSKEDEEYEQKLQLYTAQKKALDTQIADMSKQVEDQQTYRDNSVLMNIDPFHEYRSSISVYVKTDYQIMPGMMYQNPDPTLSILGAYAQIAQNGELYSSIQEKLSREVDIRDLMELIQVSLDKGSRILSIVTIADTEELASELMRNVREEMSSHKDEISAKIGEHELSVVQQSNVCSTDLDLVERVADFDTNLSNIQQNLAKAQKALNDLGSEPEKPAGVSRSQAVKGAVKYAVVGFFAGVFLALCVCVVRYLGADLIPDQEELKNRYGLRILGTVTEKRKQGLISNWADALRGIDRSRAGSTEPCGVIAEYLKGLGNIPSSIALASDTDLMVLKEVCGSLSCLLPDIRFTVVGNILNNAAALSEMKSAESVILVLSRGSSKNSFIRGALEVCRNCGRTVIGAVYWQ